MKCRFVAAFVLVTFTLIQTYIWLWTEQTDIQTGKPVDSSSQQQLSALLNALCQKYGINCILSDAFALQTFVQLETAHRRDQKHDHDSCNVLCTGGGHGIQVANWLSDGEAFMKFKDTFLSDLRKQSLITAVTADLDFDARAESLAIRHSNHRILYHIAVSFNSNAAVALVSFFYHRSYHLWTGTCSSKFLDKVSNALDSPTAAIADSLKQSIWCQSDHIFNKDTGWITSKIDGLELTIPKQPVVWTSQLREGETRFTACNLEQARRFVSVHGYEENVQAVEFRRQARELLHTAITVLDKLNVPFWLSSGTCLGWFRQCDFIPHSKDVDIGINIKHFNSKIRQELERSGLVTKHEFGHLKDSYELSFLSESDLKLDIFFFYDEPTYRWNGGTQARTGKKFKYTFDLFHLCWTEFADGLLVRVPCETLAYVKANYGPSWNIPVKEWDWKRSPPNVKENGEWPQEDWGEVIKIFVG